MSIEPSLKSHMVKFAPWAPSWEDSLDSNNKGHASPVKARKTRAKFTDTEKELINHGLDLVIGMKETKLLDQPDFLSILNKPASPHSISHYIVRKIKGTVDTITIENEDNPSMGTLLVATQSTKKDGIWEISSPLCDIGDCKVYRNSKHTAFHCIYNENEVMGAVFKKSPAKKKLRNFDALIPALQRESGNGEVIPYDGNSPYLIKHADDDPLPADTVRLEVRQPQHKDGRFVLMFNGRVKRSSSRNFILIHPSMPSREILLCGKSANRMFVLDLNWPLSLLQGFSIFLTLFSDPKAP